MAALRARLVAVAAALAVLGASGAVAAGGAVDSSNGAGTVTDRVRKAQEGTSAMDQATRLRDPDPLVRVRALKGLGDDGAPEAKNLALDALDDPDPRVQSKALDVLVQIQARDVAPALVQRMYLKGSSVPLRKRILRTLGTLGDADTARDLLEYASTEGDLELRGAAVAAAGQLADPSLAAELRGFAAKETDPNIQRVANEALARISTPKP